MISAAPHETYIAAQFDKPVFVHHYPTQVKAFYMEPGTGTGRRSAAASICWRRKGYGEITGGSERMADVDKLVAGIEEHELPMAAFDWYVDLRRYGTVVHSGFGLGSGADCRLDLRPDAFAGGDRLPAHRLARCAHRPGERPLPGLIRSRLCSTSSRFCLPP